MAQLFTKDTQAIFWNNNASAIQRMLDYDYTIGRKTPSVAGIVAPTGIANFKNFSGVAMRLWYLCSKIQRWLQKRFQMQMFY